MDPADVFDPSAHPRAADGRFRSKGAQAADLVGVGRLRAMSRPTGRCTAVVFDGRKWRRCRSRNQVVCGDHGGRRALNPFDYPFTGPAGPPKSFMWSSAGGEGNPPTTADLVGRVPVLAIGSNASPKQLYGKFPADEFHGDDGVVPVTAARVEGLDVVYAARVCSYGAMPSTVIRRPGAVCDVHVTWLTERQLARMDETEGVGSVYERVQHEGVKVEVGGGRHPVGPVFVYRSTAGAATFDGETLGVAAVSVRGNTGCRGTERDAWERLAAALGRPGWEERLAYRCVSGGSRRWRRRAIETLAAGAVVD